MKVIAFASSVIAQLSGALPVFVMLNVCGDEFDPWIVLNASKLGFTDIDGNGDGLTVNDAGVRFKLAAKGLTDIVTFSVE